MLATLTKITAFTSLLLYPFEKYLSKYTDYWTPLCQLCALSYVHKAQLLPRSVHHLFVIPLQTTQMEKNIKKEESIFVKQSKEVLRTTHSQVLDQLEEREGFTKYILVYLSSNRINNKIEQRVQMYQPYACEVYSCVLSSSVSLNALEQELTQTTLGGERFAFKNHSTFVQKQNLKLYSSTRSNAVISKLYEKIKQKIDKELNKHQKKKHT